MDRIDPGITENSSDTGPLLPARKVQERYDIADRTLEPSAPVAVGRYRKSSR
jgi:hypothetical protein